MTKDVNARRAILNCSYCGVLSAEILIFLSWNLDLCETGSQNYGNDGSNRIPTPPPAYGDIVKTEEDWNRVVQQLGVYPYESFRLCADKSAAASHGGLKDFFRGE